jgi:AcrR family transcriptional regulator
MTAPSPERRSQRARRAILQAALDLCRERGLAHMTMDEVAKRAGVGKQTIYRWWPTKAAVIQEALDDQAGDATQFPDTGDLRADLHTQMTGVAGLFAQGSWGPYASLIGAAQDDPELARSIVDTLMAPRIRACRQRLRRGQEQGQLRPDVDPDDVMELLYAPLYYRLLLHTRPVTPDQVATVIDLAFTGVAWPGRADGTDGAGGPPHDAGPPVEAGRAPAGPTTASR